MAKLYLMIVCVCCGLMTTKKAFAQLQLADSSSYNLNGHVYAITESNKELSPDEAFKAFKQHRFTKAPTPDNEFYRPLVKNVYWAGHSS